MNQVKGQMNLFDFVKPDFPEEVSELDGVVHELFADYDLEEVTYDIWEHVPYLGYRYCAFIYAVPPEVAKAGASVIESQKEKWPSLDVSINASPDCTLDIEDDRWSLMISTLWKDKKRRKQW